MPNGLDTAADGLVAFADGLRPVFVVADALKGLGSLENAISERQTAYQAAIAIHEDIKIQVEDANATLRDLKAQQATTIQQTKEAIQALQKQLSDTLLALGAAQRELADTQAKN